MFSWKKSKSHARNYANPNPHYRLIVKEDPTSVAAESYRRVKVALEYSYVDEKLQVIQICSSSQGEGKTISILNLAATYAEDGKKVIVVDLDLRCPKVHRSFKQENENGITDYLIGKITKEQAIHHGDFGVDAIFRGEHTSNPIGLLGSEKLKSFIEELRQEYDYVLIDCPPILAVSDAVLVSKFCDGCLFVVSQKRTERGAAKEAISALRDNGVKLLGVIYVDISKKGSSYGSHYYNYYYNYYSNNKK